MEKKYYEEMKQNIMELIEGNKLLNKRVYIFGHCSASLEMIDFLETFGIRVVAILDNSESKQGKEYKNVPVMAPKRIKDELDSNVLVLIISRFYEAMHKQLRELDYKGEIRKIIDYNSFAEYSMAKDTISRMTIREKHGEELMLKLSKKYPGFFFTFCPFNALGDVYFAMLYWDKFAQIRKIDNVVFCVSSPNLAEVIHLFGDYAVEVYEQKELDAIIQANLYTRNANSFIAHHDRPYVLNLSKALFIRKISLEDIYCSGVYGLPINTTPTKPMSEGKVYENIDAIPRGKAVIFSPYAKSVVAIDLKIWEDAVDYYTNMGYKCYTNVVLGEKPLVGTEAISPSILELRSVVERAGIFIGIRSGLCDVIREAKAKKIVLYPDYYYCDTTWKVIDIYWIKQFEYNIVAKGDIKWENL